VKEKLQSKCKDKIFDTQKEASEDFAADAMLSELCTDDAQVLCEDVKAGGGRVQACLRTKRPQLSWDCQEELFRKEVEDADDLRLNPTLLRLCSKDKKKFCGGACVGGVFACERRAALLTHQQGGFSSCEGWGTNAHTTHRETNSRVASVSHAMHGRPGLAPSSACML
jgi:Golgi apparatus protein 1